MAHQKNNYSVGDVIVEFISMYQFAVQHDWVCKPLSYALYHTWKKIDAVEPNKNTLECEPQCKITELDLLELQHRFGDEVRACVEEMLNGKD